jgi:hypothetical protein
MPRQFKVEELLKDERELEDLRVFARQPGRSVDELHEWLLAKGYTLGRSSVGRWKQALDEELLKERFSRSGELARAIKDSVSKGSFEDVAEAAAMQLTQVVFEQAATLQAEGKIDPLDVQRMTRSLVNLADAKSSIVQLLADKFDKEMAARAEKRPDRTITADDIAAARRAIFGS